MNMDLHHLHTVLEETFAANFVAYYRAHSAHLNIVGRTFSQDHKLLQKIYEHLQANIDTLGEKIRTTRAFAPRSLQNIVGVSLLADQDVDGDANQMLELVEESIDVLIDQYKDLYSAAEEATYVDISNYAQDQIGILAKFRWMLESTLDERSEEDDERYY